jgi:hypothetical protein
MGSDVNIKRMTGCALLAAVLFILMNWGCMFLKQEEMIFYPEKLPPDFRFSYPGRFDEHNIAVQGASLNALHFKVAQPKGIVLYFHGNAGSLREWGDVAPDFTRRGFDLFIFDYRGFGKSTGHIESEKALLEDAQAVFAFVKKIYPEDRIVLYGRSIGTGPVVYLAGANKPCMLLLESPYLSLLDLASHHYPLIPKPILKAVMKYPLRSDLWIPEVGCPVYLFHGGRDDIIPSHASERLAKLIRTGHELIFIPEGSHNNLGDFPQYQRALDRILK